MSIENLGRKLCALFLSVSLLLSYIPSPAYAMELDDSPATDSSIHVEESKAEEDGTEINLTDVGATENESEPDQSPFLSEILGDEKNDTTVVSFNAEQGESVAESYSPIITAQPEAESESMEYSEFGGAFLEVEAKAAGNGELSYKWYRVSSPEDEQLSDDYAMGSMCLAPLNMLGTSQFYCVVTNTVDGQDYSVKSNIVTIYVYKSYIAKLNLYKNENQVLSGQGYWQGKEFNVEVDRVNTYKLEILPINKEMVGKYSMAISYNGEAGEIGSYQRELVLDTSKFPVGSDGYFTVQVGEYDSASESFTASEVYKFNVTRKPSLPIILTQPQAESESMEYSESGGAFLEVEAEATDNGDLSYKWYKVNSPEDEELSDVYAMDSICLAPLNTLGKVQYYCVVTNTVGGEEFSVKTDVVTIYVYKSYIAKLNLYENGNKILDGQGYWQGKEFKINVDSANTYKLEILPINKEMVGKYSMTISYNGEKGEVGAYKQDVELDTGKFSVGDTSYLTVEVGEYDSASKSYLASEVYKFKVTKKLSLTSIAVTADEAEIAVDMSEANSTGKLKTTSAVTADEIKLTVTSNSESAKVYLGNSAIAFVSGSAVKLGDYETQTEGTKSYAVIPVKLEIPAINGQAAVTKSYTLWVEVESYYPVITLQPEPESETTEYEEFGGVFLEIEAEAKGNGELSYHWYRVSTPEDEELGDDYAMGSMCLAPKNILGTNQFYCIVTNTVNGKEYSVKSNVISFYVYKSYIAKLNLYENGNKILDGQGYWQGKEFKINVDSANTYKLEILPINKEMVGKYSMTISYNGEKGEVGAYKQDVELDTGKFSVGDTSYLTVEVGEYDSASKSYLASEVYKFKVTKKLSLTSIAVTADEAEIAVDISEANSTGKLKTTSAVTADEIKLTVTANSESAKVYLGSSTTAFVSGSAVKLGDYESTLEGTQNYVVIPIKLEIPTVEGQPAVTKEYTLWVMAEDYYPKITAQPQSVATEKSPDEFAVLEVEATVANGVLSYQWYKVGNPTDEKLEDDFSTMEMYAAPLDTIGSSGYYCIVTNTVDGKEYSVKTDIATVTVYKAYMNSLTIWADDRVVSNNQGNWNGSMFDIEINDRTDYRLNLLPSDVMGSASYSMTISYNGEAGVRTSFKSSVAIDSTKFPYGDTGYYVIEIGEYSAKTGTYTSSEVYRFNIHKYPGMKGLTVSEGNKQIPLAIDLCAVPNMRAVKTKTTQAATGSAVTISVSPIQSATTVYIGNSGEAGSEAAINPADYPVVYEGTYPYAVVPVKLVAANGTTRVYSVLVQIVESRIKISKQPVSVTCYTGDQISLNVEAVSLNGGTLSYQWYKGTQDDSELIPNANGASFAPKTDAVGEAAYYCVITDTKGETSYFVKSDAATVTTKDSNDFTPVILSQPASRITCNQGEKIALSVEVLKPPRGELSYQWYMVAAENQLVANTKDYILSTDLNSTKSYYCVVTNNVDGKEYTAKTNGVSVRTNLTKYIHAAEVIGQPGTYIFDKNTGMVPGGYTAVAKGNSAPTPFNVRFQYVDYDVDSIVTLYHSTTNSYDGAELVKDAICSEKQMGGYTGGGWYKEYEINPNTAYPTGEHYFYVVITLSPSDKNSTVKPVSTKSDTLKIDFTDRETTMDGAGTEQNPYIIKTTEHLSEIQKMVADGDSFAGAYFQIANDVSLPTNWTPIGTRDTAFSGHIDGNHKKLTVPAGEKPLLGCINGASVKDLDIYGEQIEGAGLVDDFTGVGLSGSAIVLDNVTLKSGSKTLKSGLVAAGAGNGYASASAGFVMTIRNCTVESNVVVGYTGTESQIGSIAGRFQGTIENCTSSATVKGKDYVGGIIGTRDNAMAQCVVKNSTFHGTVESSGSYAGGIVGGGYDNSTAPNGACPTILACTVDGAVKGNERVGGIFGGDGFVAQTWDNVVGSISANSFTGKVSGNKYVGAIIGYRDSLNRYDNIAGNTYSAGCGADKGIGYVKYLDTSYANPTKMDGTIVFNTANGTSDCPTVEGCAWRANHNRTDDPLGADADKLCRVAGGSTEPICYELTASGTYKTEYTVGDELDLTGIVLTASWSNGTTTDVALSDVTVDGYDQNKVGIQTITLKYGDAVAYITVTVKPESVKITVAVSILGDEKHGAVDEPHGLARGGLTAWAEDTSVEADTAETVWDVLQRVAKSKDIELDAFYSEQYGTYYIRGVNGLSEKDNGENSGWMYTVNGKHPEVGVSARFVNENDQIILHYTDDYTYEEDGENYGKEPPVTPKPDKTNATELLSGKSTTLKVLGKNGKVLGKNDITWTLKDPQDSIYATISATGTVKAKTVLTKHDVTFVGTLKGSYEGTVEQVVTILPKVTQVEIVKDGENVTGKTLSLNAVEGETLTLTAKVYPDELAQEVTWKSSNTKIAQIDAEGTVSFAGKTGTVTVTATSTDGSRISATVKLQVGVLTKSVTIGEPADHTLRSGKSLTLKAITDPVEPTVSGVTFKLVNASDSAYVSVSTSGKVSAKTVNEPHVVKIYAVSKDAAAVESNEITLTILPKNVQSLILKSGDKYVTNGKVVRNVNEELTLKAYTLDTTDGAVEETRDVTWTSSNTKVATIDETGKVTCVKTGTVKLTATADKKTKAAVTLKVTNLVNGITIVTKNDKDSMVVASGKSLALKATVQPANASQKAVTWSMVSGSSYAKISSSGVVSANKGLTSPVTVTVKAVAKDGSGMEATQEITINPVALGVTISDVNHERTTGTLVWNMTEADNIQFSANVYPVKAVQAVTWKSSNAKIAAVDGTGKVTCYKAGTVTITATAKDGSGKKASLKLNIIKKLKSLTLEDQTVEGGKSLQLKAILDPVDPTNKKLTWTVSSNNVGAKISSSGKLTTKKVTKDTKVMVTVSSNDGTGLTATCFVTITPSVKK